MHKNDMLLYAADLHLFDGEGCGAAPAAAAEGEAQSTVPGNTRRGKSGEYANVAFGKQDSAAGDQTDAQNGAPEPTKATKESRKADFRALVEGEYKDIYTEETQRIIDRRFKETRNLEAAMRAQQPLIDTLMRRYGVTDGKIETLTQAVNDDSSYWERVSMESGMPVEQCKRLEALEAENARLARDDKVNAQVAQWTAEADEMKARFPDFDFEAEIENPRFIAMLKSGVPVEHAYKVLHMDELMQNVVQTTAQRAEKRVVDNVRSRGTRPQENGTASRSAITVKDDVSRLTKEDRAEIARRVARGEIIKF
jgi:hypothetical protein